MTEPFDPNRTEFDGWAEWRVRIVRSDSRFRKRRGFKYIVQRRFQNWDTWGVSRWFSTIGACERAGTKFLDKKSPFHGIRQAN